MKQISLNLIFCLIILLTNSCQSEHEKELVDDCDGLAMKYYRGLPRPATLYKEHCQKKEDQLQYTPHKCKLAMKDLMLYGSKRLLKENHGSRILECFNNSDLNSFIK